METLPERVEEDVYARELPPGLWDRLRADPLRAPEYIALAAADRHGPVAEAWVADKRRRFAHTPHELALMAKKRHASMARFEGAATGIGGFITIVPDMAALAWIQSRMVFFIAASFGFDPLDPMRPAELLVLQGSLFTDPQSARQSLDGIGKTVAEAYVGSKLTREEAMFSRLSRMVGKRIARRYAGRLIPFAAIGFNAVGNERETRALADRAIKFYGG